MAGDIERLGKWLRNEQIPAVNTHMEMHCLLGEAWFASYFQSGIGATGTVDILAIPATGSIEPHIFRRISVHSDALLYAFEGFTLTASGTAMNAANYRRMAQGVNAPTLLLFSQPAIAAPGTQYGPQIIPGGNTANAQGSTFESRFPVTLGPGIPVIFRVQNNSGRVSDIGFEISWFEDTIVDPALPGI